MVRYIVWVFQDGKWYPYATTKLLIAKNTYKTALYDARKAYIIRDISPTIKFY